jgi:uncharacterized iron-regulated membrane protein
MSNLFTGFVDFLKDEIRQTSTDKEVVQVGQDVKQTANEEISQLQTAYIEKKASDYLPYIIGGGILLFLILKR